jgi:hypothetical protein
MNTFKQFANSTIKASPILTEEEIELLLRENNLDPLYRYAYRIAGFVTVYMRRKGPQLDDGDWQDAAQECMIEFPSILEQYRASDAPFLRYMSRAFQNTIRRYAWGSANGGTGSFDTDAELVVYLTHGGGDWGTLVEPLTAPSGVTVFEDEENNEHMLTVQESTGFTMRDSLVELMAEEAMERALRHAKRHPKPGPREW